MAQITSQKAIEAIGGDQFLLIRMASYRARILIAGKDKPRVNIKDNKMGVVAIREIEEGMYTKEEYENNLAGNLPGDDENKIEVNDEY